MGVTKFHKFFESHNDQYLKFDRIEDKICNRADLHAFLLLDRIIPGSDEIVAASEHDEIYLGIDCDELAEVATESQLIDLIRCGVRYDSATHSLCMFK